jgi:hypothetical protein
VVTASGGANMTFNATGGLFLANGLVVFHEGHGWTPNVAAFDRNDSIFIARSGNDDSTVDSKPLGYTYEYNLGLEVMGAPLAPPSGGWGDDWVRIANIFVPAGVTRSDQCTITDVRDVRYFPL